MSHAEKQITSLGCVSQSLLSQALEIVAKKFGGTVEKSIKDYYGNTLTEHEDSPFIGAIKTPKVPRGIGMNIKDGKLTFVGDSWGYQNHYFELQKEIERTYKVLARAKAFQVAGYDLEIEEHPTLGTILRGSKP